MFSFRNPTSTNYISKIKLVKKHQKEKKTVAPYPQYHPTPQSILSQLAQPQHPHQIDPARMQQFQMYNTLSLPSIESIIPQISTPFPTPTPLSTPIPHQQHSFETFFNITNPIPMNTAQIPAAAGSETNQPNPSSSFNFFDSSTLTSHPQNHPPQPQDTFNHMDDDDADDDDDDDDEDDDDEDDDEEDDNDETAAATIAAATTTTTTTTTLAAAAAAAAAASSTAENAAHSPNNSFKLLVSFLFRLKKISFARGCRVCVDMS
jgi:hypothetical protein